MIAPVRYFCHLSFAISIIRVSNFYFEDNFLSYLFLFCFEASSHKASNVFASINELEQSDSFRMRQSAIPVAYHSQFWKFWKSSLFFQNAFKCFRIEWWAQLCLFWRSNRISEGNCLSYLIHVLWKFPFIRHLFVSMSWNRAKVAECASSQFPSFVTRNFIFQILCQRVTIWVIFFMSLKCSLIRRLNIFASMSWNRARQSQNAPVCNFCRLCRSEFDFSENQTYVKG